jgi:hypothetical protein
MNKTQNNYNKKACNINKRTRSWLGERERDREKCKETHTTQSDVLTSVSQKN